MNKKLLTTSVFFATSIAMAFEPWIGSDTPTPYYVNTGLDNGTNTAGYWFVKDDHDDGGESKVVWPVATGNELNNNSLDPIIEHCKGVCGTAKLNKGTLTYNPFVTVGFNVVGDDENSGLPAPGDASSWGGICITYRSDAAPSLELSLGDAVDATIGYALPAASLPRSKNGESYKKCIPWSGFKQPSWYKGKTKISGTEAAAQLVSINFKMQNAPGQYKFNICGIGPYGEKIEGEELPTGAKSLPTTCPEFRISLEIPEISVNAKWSPQGDNYEATIIVMDGDYELTKDKDYKIEQIVSNNTSGEITTTIKGMGDYMGTVEKTFDKPKSITDNSIIVADIPVQTYVDFRQVCPSSSLVIVTDGKDTLKAGSDYIFECPSNNPQITSGTLDNAADLKITGINKYAGEITKKFFIWKNIGYYAAVQVFEDADGKAHAEIDGAYNGTDAVAFDEDITVESVVFNRTFPKNTYSTIVLPFDVNTANVSGLQAVLYYNGIGKDKNGKDAVKMKVLWAEKGVIKDADGNDKEYEHTTISANTPYLVKMKSAEFKVDGKVTLKATTEAVKKYPEWEWEFRGVWEYKKWESGDPELGVAYGFAANSSADNKIQVGDFVKVGVGAWIRPMRAYLVKSDVAPKAQGVRANGAYVMRPTVEQKELPELMSIIVDDGDGNDDNAEHTTVIGQFNTRTGEIKMNYDHGKFDLKGRRVNGSNNARGAYYGKKVLK